MTDEHARYLAAKEALTAADWLFDEFVNAEMAKVLKSAPADKEGREDAYLRARVATELKMTLLGIVNDHEDVLLLKESREKLKESLHG